MIRKCGKNLANARAVHRHYTANAALHHKCIGHALWPDFADNHHMPVFYRAQVPDQPRLLHRVADIGIRQLLNTNKFIRGIRQFKNLNAKRILLAVRVVTNKALCLKAGQNAQHTALVDSGFLAELCQRHALAVLIEQLQDLKCARQRGNFIISFHVSFLKT